MKRDHETAFRAAVTSPTKANWQAIADQLQAEATTKPATKAQREAADLLKYCTRRAEKAQ